MIYNPQKNQKVWILRKRKPEEWRIVDPNYDWLGFKAIKLQNGKDCLFAKPEQCFLNKHDCK